MRFKILQSLYTDIRDELRAAGLDAPDLEARIILKDVCTVTDADLIAGKALPVKKDDRDKVHEMVRRRISGEPLSHIRGFKEFWGRRFFVSDSVLDPRPDTETIISSVVETYKARGIQPATILDLGTGSGCLAITLLCEFPKAHAVAVDLSEDALRIAEKNARSHGVENRLRFVRGRWFDGITQRFDLIVSNPPYIPSDDIASLDSVVKNHDPILALDGGDDGLIAYRAIITEIDNFLSRRGRAFFEIGINQESDVKRIVKNTGLEVIRVHADLAGIPRVVEISVGEK